MSATLAHNLSQNDTTRKRWQNLPFWFCLFVVDIPISPPDNAFMLKRIGVSLVIFGFVIIFLQFIFPDLIPDIVNKILEQEHPQFLGYDAMLKLFLALWYLLGIGGLILIFFGLPI